MSATGRVGGLESATGSSGAVDVDLPSDVVQVNRIPVGQLGDDGRLSPLPPEPCVYANAFR